MEAIILNREFELPRQARILRTVTCPNCQNKFDTYVTEMLRKEFACPTCGAILANSNRERALRWGPYIAFSLMALPLCAMFVMFSAVNTIHDLGALVQWIPLPITMLLAIVALGILGSHYLGMKVEVIRLSESCRCCGSLVLIKDSQFCPKCGASLSTVSGNLALHDGQVKIVSSAHAAAGSEIVGTCIICKKDLKPHDTPTWCPYCGSPAHKTHLLEYLHVHGQCPACGNHIEEKELTQQLSQEPKQPQRQSGSARVVKT